MDKGEKKGRTVAAVVSGASVVRNERHCVAFGDKFRVFGGKI
jgi:hypothetical protein